MTNPHILICDDNEAVHESISAYLRAEGMTYNSVYDGEMALKKAVTEKYDLIILDVMMPKMFGTDVCKKIRKTSYIPIIMLTAKGEEIDRIIGLEIGADDYVVKPFSPREVVTRIKTILKRTSPKEEKSKDVIVCNELTIDMDRYEVYINANKIELTPKEIEVFYFLASGQGRAYTREQILDKVWGYDYYGDTRVVDTQMKRLRKKISEEEVTFQIKSIYGVGYKFEVIK